MRLLCVRMVFSDTMSSSAVRATVYPRDILHDLRLACAQAVLLAKDLCLLGEAVGQLEVAFEIAPAAPARGVCLRSGVVAATSRAASTPIRLATVAPVNFPFAARGLSHSRGFLREGGPGLGGKVALRCARSAVRALVVCG